MKSVETTLHQWMTKKSSITARKESLICRLNHYTAGHQATLKEATTLLELALWKANLDDDEGDRVEREGAAEESKERDLHQVWYKHCDQECLAISLTT